MYLSRVLTDKTRILPNSATETKDVLNANAFNPLKVPPNIEMAKRHGKAKRIYVSKEKDGLDEKDKEICECCDLPVEGKPLPVNCKLEDLYHLGSGFALYFGFIKFSIVLLAIIFSISGLYNLITNSTGDGCIDAVTYSQSTSSDYFCVQGSIITYALPNKNDDHMLAQLILNIVTVILMMAFFQYVRYRFRKIEIQADDQTVTPSDYTILIKNLPPHANDTIIKDHIGFLVTDKMPLKVVRIIRPLTISKYVELTKKSMELAKKLEILKIKEQNNPTAKGEEELENIKSVIQKIGLEQADLKGKGEIKECPIAYVTFETAQQANYVATKFQRSVFDTFLGYFCSPFTNTIKVKRAPEPSDIIWENLPYSSKARFYKKLWTAIFVTVLIAISFGIIIGVNLAQDNFRTTYGEKSTGVRLFSILSSLVIFVTNTALSMIIIFLTKFEKHQTQSFYTKGLTSKLAIAQFINTALTSILVEIIIGSLSDVADDKRLILNVDFYKAGGLIQNIFWVFITNALLTPFLSFVDFGYLFKRYKQRKLTNQSLITQQEAHEIFEGPVFNMPTKYAAIVKMMLMAAFYAPVLPICIVFTAVGLFLIYWADKYSLLKRNSLQNSIDDEVVHAMIRRLDWAAFAFAAGNIFYILTLRDSTGHNAIYSDLKYLVWISIGLSILHVVLPKGLLNTLVFKIDDKVTEIQTFEQARENFQTDYDMENPVTRRKALLEFRKKLEDDPEKGEKVKTLNQQLFEKLEKKSAKDPSSQTPEQGQGQEIDFAELDDYIVRTEKKKATVNPKKKVSRNNVDSETEKLMKNVLEVTSPNAETANPNLLKRFSSIESQLPVKGQARRAVDLEQPDNSAARRGNRTPLTNQEDIENNAISKEQNSGPNSRKRI